MTPVIVYLAASLLIVVSLARLFFVGANYSDNTGEGWPDHDFWSADGSAMHISAHLFGNDDWKFVQELKSKGLVDRFMHVRTRLALTWVRAARSEAQTLMRVHRAAASTSPHLNLRDELQIACLYAGFLFYCALLEIAIRMRGPVGLQRLVARADSHTVRLYEAVGQFFPLAQRERLN